MKVITKTHPAHQIRNLHFDFLSIIIM